MANLFRKYNQNRKTLWTSIIFVAFFVILLQAIFAIIRSSQNRERQERLAQANMQKNNTVVNQITEGNNTTSNTVNSSDSRANYRKMAEQEINNFAQYCNSNQIEEAYNMLTTDCKQVLFPTINEFNNNYVQKIFTQKRSIKVEDSMYGDLIYKVSYYADILANGGPSQENTLQDYIRIEQKDQDYKLSLNKFLYSENISKIENTNAIYMKVVQKQVYIDYEIYQVQITNQTQNTLLLSTRKENNTVSLIDEKEVEYPANMDEQAIERLIVKPGATTLLNIKFNKIYNQERKDQAIKFLDIVSDYEKYQRGEETEKIRLSIRL